MKSLKSFKAVVVFSVAAAILFVVGYDMQRSANAEWKAKSGMILAARVECGNEAKTRAWTYGGSSSEAESRFKTDVEACGKRMLIDAETLHAVHSDRMDKASGILVFAITFFLIGIFTLFDVVFNRNEEEEWRTDEEVRQELVRMRVTSIQRRSRLAKRENALRRLELARS